MYKTWDVEPFFSWEVIEEVKRLFCAKFWGNLDEILGIKIRFMIWVESCGNCG